MMEAATPSTSTVMTSTIPRPSAVRASTGSLVAGRTRVACVCLAFWLSFLLVIGWNGFLAEGLIFEASDEVPEGSRLIEVLDGRHDEQYKT